MRPKPSKLDNANPQRFTRRGLLKAGVGLIAAGGAAAAYARYIEPKWIAQVILDLPVSGLPPAWECLRVALIADLHHSKWASIEFLAGAIARVRALEPDLLAVAGDFILGDDLADQERVAGLFSGWSAPLGTFACLGNHDYGLWAPVGRPGVPPYRVAEALRASGVRLLCNEAARLTRQGQDLWLVGVEDYWSGRCRPVDATRGLPQGAPNLTLCHNPDAAEALEAARCGTILAGHTHGGQVQIPLLGPPFLPVVNRKRYEGLHRVGRSWLYINRGLASMHNVRFKCRPEITLLTLRPAAGQ